jgi:HAE1 family hydrophobic/amphiphilic exporter-1
MRFTHFFVDRPIFATVIAVFITLIGAIAFFALPVAQYPDIAPPTIIVQTSYPGASSNVVSDTVATPIEEQINGVENMLYMSSQSTADGNLRLTVTFKVGTDLNIAQVLVQNRVAIALPRLPPEVQQNGVTVQKSSPDLLMVIHLYSPDNSRDQLYLSNFANFSVTDILARQPGVGSVVVFGARDYSMRVWLDPDKVAARNLTAGDVVGALAAQNIQVAGGVLGQPPMANPGAFQLSVQTLGRLTEPDEFAGIIVKSDAQGRITRLGDVARIELGARDYNANGYLDDKRAVPMGVFQLPGSNALATADKLLTTMDELGKSFPPGVAWTVVYNPTQFIAASVREVIHTIYLAVILVVIVIFVFLHTWRAAVIPIVAIPVSLVGTFAMLQALGYSLNNLTLFGLVLAVGTVVDDAIVVVENVERNLRKGLTPLAAAHATMDEVGTALVAIALVLSSVFIPAAFVPGISGLFFRQFAVTVATSTIISLVISLTLSPALAALLFKTHSDHETAKRSRVMRFLAGASAGFNNGFDWLAGRYGSFARQLMRISLILLVVYAGLILLAGREFYNAPKGFIPEQDQGTMIAAIQLPPGASLARTDEVELRAIQIALKTPGVAHVTGFSGTDVTTFTSASNAGLMFVTLKPFEERYPLGLTGIAVRNNLNMRLAAIQDARSFVFFQPPVRGIGTAGGWKMIVEDRRGNGFPALEAASNDLIAAANKVPGLLNVFTLFNTRTPSVYVDIDRTRAQMLGVPPQRVFEAMQDYVGGLYVDDFNYHGRDFHVTVQADSRFRADTRSIANLKTRNDAGQMVPLGSVASFRTITGPYRIPHYNIFPATEIQGATTPEYSSGYAVEQMKQLAAHILPDGFGYEWTELALQEVLAGNNGMLVFVASVIFVFLVLAAQYESWALPLSVVLIVPMCLLAAIEGLNASTIPVNILAQVGFIVLVGLAAKNAILIVEFARQGEAEGMDRVAAAVHAARTRLRPILMTTLAFVLGVVPLMIGTGAGHEMRASLGTAVFYGMIGVTVFGLIFTPIFYVVIRGVVIWLNRGKAARLAHATPHGGAMPAPAPRPAQGPEHLAE